MLTGESSILKQADKAKFKTELSAIKEQLELFKVEKIIEDSNFEEGSLTAGKEMLEYNTKKADEIGNIETIFINLKDKYKEKLEVIKGELYYATKSEQEIKWLQELEIQPNPYEIVDGELLSSYGNLLLLDEKGTLTIPGSVTKIGEGAFANLEGLKTIIIPGTCKEIARNAFANNATLETVIMQEGVEKIGANAFQYCIKLKTVQMPNSVIELQDNVFFGDSCLEKVKLSSGLKRIPSYAFHNCRSLKEIDFHEGLETITSSAFANCEALKSIKIPKSMLTIHGTAFNGAISLTSIEVNSQNTNFEFKNGMLLGNKKQEICIILESAITSNIFTVPEGVVRLEGNPLAVFSKINELEIPSSVTKIDNAFFSRNIKKVTIDSKNNNYESDGKAVYTKGKETLLRYYANENSVTLNLGTISILANAFNGQSNITEINLPNTLKSIGGQAFAGCNKLTSIHLGENVNNFNNMSIYGSAIKNVTIDENNPNYSMINGVLYNKDGTIFISPIKNIAGTYEIPNGVKEISDNAFHNQSQMKGIILPNTLEKIGNSLNYCTSLTRIEIPSNVSEIGERCFENCGNNLKQIIIHKPKGSISGSPWKCVYGEKAIIWQE